jgi:hypothetical protein
MLTHPVSFCRSKYIRDSDYFKMVLVLGVGKLLITWWSLSRMSTLAVPAHNFPNPENSLRPKHIALLYRDCPQGRLMQLRRVL